MDFALDWPKRGRGRPTAAERDFRRRLEQENRKRIRHGLVAVLVWEGRLYCRSRCIIKDTGLFTDDAMMKRYVEDGDPWDAGDYIENGNGRAIGIMRTRVARGQWPLPRYVVRRHYAADIEHIKCRGCGGAFRRAKPDTEWTRRVRRQWKKRNEQARLERDRRYRKEAKERRERERADQERRRLEDSKKEAAKTPEQRAAENNGSSERARADFLREIEERRRYNEAKWEEWKQRHPDKWEEFQRGRK